MKKRFFNKVLMLVGVFALGSMVACDSPKQSMEGSAGVEAVPEEADTDETIEKQSVLAETTPIAFEDIAGEDIYEVKEDGDTTYYATKYGIYKVTAVGNECIYDKGKGQEGFSGSEPHMCIYAGRLYFKTDLNYKDSNSVWQDCGIRYVDLETLASDVVMTYLSEEAQLVDFWVSDGYLVLCSEKSDGEMQHKIVLLNESGKLVYNGKAVEDLTDIEREEYGQKTSKWLLENPGKLLSVANRTFTETFAILDLNGDGIVEEILLQPDETRNIAYTPLDSYVLKAGEQVLVEGFAENMCNDIWAISPNGKDILLVLYADGPSEDPYTWFYRYENGGLIEAGGFGTDIRSCEISEDGVISGVIRHDVIQTDFITAKWQFNGQKQMEQITQDAYEFELLNEVKMLQPLMLHTEPGSAETFVLEAQSVMFTKVSGDDKWILLETLTGESGWLEVIDHMTVEDNKSIMDVFDGETMIFAD